jgi:TPP-dependent pyruvate/acetoin dehydrogenase alpha subunit
MSLIEDVQAAEVALAELGPLPYVLPLGPLAPLVAGAFSGASRADWVVCGPRERVGAVLRGCGLDRLVDAAAGARPYKLAPTSGAPGARALHAVGLAMATETRVLCILGDASTAAGAFHEALNAAVLVGASVTFLVVHQPLTDDAPVGTQLATSPAKLAAAFGIPVTEIAAAEDAVRDAVAAARDVDGPAFIQATLTRAR